MRKQPKNLGLRLTLADLFMKLSKTDMAIRVCDESIQMLGTADSVESLMSRTRVLQLKAAVSCFCVWLFAVAREM